MPSRSIPGAEGRSPPEVHPPSPGLRRSLTLTHTVLYGLGVTIGAGIYVLIAAAAERAGMHAPISFVVTAISISLTGASLAELGSRMPVAAAEAAYARAAFRSQRMATFTGLLVTAISLLTAATITAGAAEYIRVFVNLPDKVIICLVVVSMSAIAARGIIESVAFAGLMTAIEIGGLLAVIAAGFLFEPAVMVRAPEILPRGLDASEWSGIFTASLLAVFAFIGFEGIVNVAEEMREPERTLPRAIFLTLAITTVLYVLVMWVSLAALGAETLAASSAPLALVFERLTGASPRTMSAIAVIATLNGIVVNVIMASRVIYGLARQGNLPAALARINPRTRTPLEATVLSAAVVLSFALILPIAELADLSARATLVMFGVVNLALFFIKRREAHPPKGIFVCPKWVPLAGFLNSILFVAADLVFILRIAE